MQSQFLCVGHTQGLNRKSKRMVGNKKQHARLGHPQGGHAKFGTTNCQANAVTMALEIFSMCG
jgi:hypothetical protein